SMASTVHSLEDLESRVATGEPLSRADAERVLATPDLVSVGVLGEIARRRRSGERVTFGRVALAPRGDLTDAGVAGEVRITGTPSSIDEAVAWVRHARAAAPEAVLTGFACSDVVAWARTAGTEHAAGARMLREAGLDGVAEVVLDRAGSIDDLVRAVVELTEGGLGAWRLVVDRAPLAT